LNNRKKTFWIYYDPERKKPWRYEYGTIKDAKIIHASKKKELERLIKKL